MQNPVDDNNRTRRINFINRLIFKYDILINPVDTSRKENKIFINVGILLIAIIGIFMYEITNVIKKIFKITVESEFIISTRETFSKDSLLIFNSLLRLVTNNRFPIIDEIINKYAKLILNPLNLNILITKMGLIKEHDNNFVVSFLVIKFCLYESKTKMAVVGFPTNILIKNREEELIDSNILSLFNSMFVILTNILLLMRSDEMMYIGAIDGIITFRNKVNVSYVVSLK